MGPSRAAGPRPPSPACARRGYCGRVGGLLGDIAGWFGRVGAELAQVSVPLLLLALVLQTGQTALNAVAWRTILRAAYPQAGVRFGPVFGAYAGGVGLNHVLPAQAGTVAMVGLFRLRIPGATVPGLTAACAVQTLFFAVAGVAVYAALLIARPGAGDVHFADLRARWWLTVLIAAVVVVAGTLAVRVLWHRVRHLRDDVEEGVAILRRPRRFVLGVLVPQGGSYALRLGVIGALMAAYGIPISARALFLVLAAVSLSTLLALTPGGVGTQQALATIALAGTAPASVLAAYSLGQQLILTAFDVALGAAALALTVGWAATLRLVRGHHRPAGAGDAG